jgi:hypothetical protein
MVSLKRRDFLYFASSTLTAIGLSQFKFLYHAERYGQALAQDTPRKLALLIGINRYESVRSLRGCTTDVLLQKHLLMSRFGFHKNDILELTSDTENPNLKPTRKNILRAMEEHVIKQVKPGDVVVIHYSGHGSLVQDPTPLKIPGCTDDCDKNGTIVPQDAAPLEQNGTRIIVPDIMGKTLFLLMRAINTENLTLILDSCHSGAGTRGSVTVRAADRLSQDGEILIPCEQEYKLQEEWLKRLKLKPEKFQQERQAGIAKGVALGSAQRDQMAVDANFGDFHAGGFTYLLTRYLWQLTGSESVETIRDRLILSTSSLADAQQNRTGQVPVFEYKPKSNNQKQPIYFINLATPPADAVVTRVADEVQFWLGGVSSQNLRADSKGTVFNLLDGSGKAVGTIEQTGRSGLYGWGQLQSGNRDALREGSLLQEQVLGIEANPILKIGIDASLGRELEQAKMVLAEVPRVEVVPVQQVTQGDYLLGQMTTAYQRTLSRGQRMGLPAPGTIGLVAHDLTPIVDSFGTAGESVTAAVNRLRPYLKRLLANQILEQLIAAGSSSLLNVRARIYAANGKGREIQIGIQRVQKAIRGIPRSNRPPRFKDGTKLKVEVENLTDADLYLSIMVIDTEGKITLLYPTNWQSPEESARLARIGKGGKLTMPEPERDNFDFTVRGTSGFPELLILVSTEPLRKALKGMQSIARSRNIMRGPIYDSQGGFTEDESLNILDGLLGDLNELTRSRERSATLVAVRTEQSSDLRRLDVSTLAVLSTVFEVVQ